MIGLKYAWYDRIPPREGFGAWTRSLGQRECGMIDKGFEELLAREPTGRLRQLEQDIWARERTCRTALTLARKIASWQAIVVLVASFASAEAGVQLASRTSRTRIDWLTAGAQLTPSALLFGPKR